ncbi:DUF7146 domain-containing protein [Iodobacter fluviatilis]|uniref:DNA primase/helicase n=1 Tax=Iodobacter fluviatilis TaxID=537 RepID=A0A377Q5H0_9NEIS|nr:toprim domain-containing protein [Iodobacter fluviatilis]TCU84542.1 putative DNA primase/helicase [Iodobacter fluviatilis]STQ90008.1 Uncharacterized protein conserved in bacteria [Iodobacter fluviatilis]
MGNDSSIEMYKERIKNTISLANGHWLFILDRLGIDKKYLSGSNTACPVCKGTDRFQFHDRNENGDWFCRKAGGHSQSGNGFNLLMESYGWSFHEALVEVEKTIQCNSYRTELKRSISYSTQLKEKQDAAEKIQKILKSSFPFEKNDPVGRYLKARGYEGVADKCDFLFHPSLAYWEKQGSQFVKLGTYPAMIAKVVNTQGEIISLHRLWLTPEGKKAPVPCQKKSMPPIGGSMKGCSIQLFKPDSGPLVLATGIETSLGAAALTQRPAWATMSDAMLGSVILPSHTTEVWVFGDSDFPCTNSNNPGKDAAIKAAQTYRDQGKKVRLFLPQTPGLDFDDVWQTGQYSQQNKIAA